MLAIAAPRLTLLAKMKPLVSIGSKDLTISKFTTLFFNDYDFTYYAIVQRVSPTVRHLPVILKQEKSWLRRTLWHRVIHCSGRSKTMNKTWQSILIRFFGLRNTRSAPKMPLGNVDNY